MIPRLTELEPVTTQHQTFLAELKRAGFQGDIADKAADRLVGSTDNSIYQILPQALIYPRSEEDVSLIFRLAQKAVFRELTFTARGGGTGTNGQSLSSGIIVDFGRHLHRVISFDESKQLVTVESGIVRDELNDFLAPYGLFFAPNLSPSSRATIGGMIGTDASGQGSRRYGKTSEHVESLTAVLYDGTVLKTRPLSGDDLLNEMQRTDLVGQITRDIMSIVSDYHQDFLVKLPKLQRFLTGYNLQMAWDQVSETLDLKWLFTGAEGTLGTVTSATLRTTPIPKKRALAILEFSSFDHALAAAENMLKLEPSSIETVDGTVLELAREDIIFQDIESYLPLRGSEFPKTESINLVEFEGNDAEAVENARQALLDACETHAGEPGWPFLASACKNEEDRLALWRLRAKGVGLLGRMKGHRKPVPFVEDTVVPPSNLSAYVREFRDVLDREAIPYCMYGHVDVGCLHVRPALDLKTPEDEKKVERISNEVAKLCQKYGGVIWGEHGKGFRSEYSPLHFGDLFPALERIKAIFDPDDRLNPGKVATTPGNREQLLGIKQPLRGHKDRQMSAQAQKDWHKAIDCNGNGLCFHYSPSHVMCPSSKYTRDRVHTPKGRAGVMREWLRQLESAGQQISKRSVANIGGFKQWLTAPIRAFHSLQKKRGEFDYSHEVMRAMEGCLACKACATQCPVQVDVPSFRADFYAAYHTRYLRPIRDHLVAGLERALQLMSKLPLFFNFFLQKPWFQKLMGKYIGLVDTPILPKHHLTQLFKNEGIQVLKWKELGGLSEEAKAGSSVILLQDAFTSYYEPEIVITTHKLLEKLGFKVHVAPFFPNGKALHIKGFLKRFERLVKKNHKKLSRLAKTGAHLLTIDPAVALTYRDEYQKVPKLDWTQIRVKLLQEFLVQKLPKPDGIQLQSGPSYRLMGHCTEKTLAPASEKKWVEVFSRLGLKLEPVAVGCCGMCGVFGHESIHLDESRGIWDLSWKEPVEAEPELSLATGYSCRTQANRFSQLELKHPVDILLRQVENQLA